MSSSRTYNWRGYQINLTETPAGHQARSTIPTKYGPVALEVHVPHELVRMAVRGLAPRDVVSGDFMSDLKGTLGQIGKSAAFNQATSVISQAAANPLLQGAAAAALGPGGSVALQGIGLAAGAANALAANARKGDPAARQAIGKVAQRAKAGDPRAKHAAGLLHRAVNQQIAAERAQQAQQAQQVPPGSVWSPEFGWVQAPAAQGAFPYGQPVADGPYDAMAARYGQPVAQPDGTMAFLQAPAYPSGAVSAGGDW